MSLEKHLNLVYQVLRLILKVVILNVNSFYRTFVIRRPRKCVKNQVILITGGGGSLGREMSIRFSKLGAVLVLWDIDEIAAEKTARKIEEAGGTAYFYQCDISDPIRVAEVAKHVFQDVGQVDILVNNAGIFHSRKLLKLRDQDIRRTVEVNLLAHYWTIRQFLPKMLERNSGQIAAISSVAGIQGQENMVDYSGSKFGVVGMMDALEEEMNAAHNGHNIRLTTLMPLGFQDGMVRGMTPKFNFLTPFCELETIASLAVDAILRNEEKTTLPRRFGHVMHFLSFLLCRSAIKEAVRFTEYACHEHR